MMKPCRMCKGTHIIYETMQVNLSTMGLRICMDCGHLERDVFWDKGPREHSWVACPSCSFTPGAPYHGEDMVGDDGFGTTIHYIKHMESIIKRNCLDCAYCKQHEENGVWHKDSCDLGNDDCDCCDNFTDPKE